MSNLVEAGFREWNHTKIDRLTKANCSNETIASAINDEMKEKKKNVRFTDKDIESYKKFTSVSKNTSMISEEKVRALTGDDGSPQPA